MDHLQPQPLADPVHDRALELKLEPFAGSHAPHAAAGLVHASAGLNRYDIAVVLQAVDEWGGYRFTSATEAIAAAKRGRK